MKKVKQGTLFIFVGILLLLGVVGIIFYSINFLLENTGEALNQTPQGADKITRFNFEGLKELGITE